MGFLSGDDEAGDDGDYGDDIALVVLESYYPKSPLIRLNLY